MAGSLDPIETLVALDAGGRGIARLVRPGEARRAAESLFGGAGCLLLTGFVVRPGEAAETDGPSGTVALGRALHRLGKAVHYLADLPVLPLLEASGKALGEPLPLIPLPGEPAAALREARTALRSLRPTHLVAIERPGRAADGEYYNTRGLSVTAWNAPLDRLFLRRRGLVTVGVGDGGNEVGMGRVRRAVGRCLPHGATIASTVATDHLVVAGTSNWGAWALVAYLSLLAGRQLLPTPEEERRLIEAQVEVGGVDGITGQAAPTVDGLPLALHQRLLGLLRELTEYGLAQGDGRRATRWEG
ncbi:MAG: DUF4392 domain-containing protein [Candidatus Rokubacteria bacterium]|nr:DUF4392 domain-containing protein [Candidatus Rokubacteria bacterium]